MFVSVFIRGLLAQHVKLVALRGTSSDRRESLRSGNGLRPESGLTFREIRHTSGHSVAEVFASGSLVQRRLSPPAGRAGGRTQVRRTGNNGGGGGAGARAVRARLTAKSSLVGVNLFRRPARQRSAGINTVRLGLARTCPVLPGPARDVAGYSTDLYPEGHEFNSGGRPAVLDFRSSSPTCGGSACTNATGSGRTIIDLLNIYCCEILPIRDGLVNNVERTSTTFGHVKNDFRDSPKLFLIQ